MPGLNNWCLQTVSQNQLGDRVGYQPRGKGVGGSSLINGMIYLRGRSQDYDSWQQSGCEGWGWDSVAPIFEGLEGRLQTDDAREGRLAISSGLSNSEGDKLFF